MARDENAVPEIRHCWKDGQRMGMKKRSEGQRRFLISFRNQLAAEAVAALCLNDSLDSHSSPPPPLSFSLCLTLRSVMFAFRCAFLFHAFCAAAATVRRSFQLNANLRRGFFPLNAVSERPMR